MQAIDEILELLRNGEWHELEEVAHKAGMQEFRLELISSFLAEYDFLEFDKKSKRVRLSPQLLAFLKKLEEAERAEGATKKKHSVVMNLIV